MSSALQIEDALLKATTLAGVMEASVDMGGENTQETYNLLLEALNAVDKKAHKPGADRRAENYRITQLTGRAVEIGLNQGWFDEALASRHIGLINEDEGAAFLSRVVEHRDEVQDIEDEWIEEQALRMNDQFKHFKVVDYGSLHAARRDLGLPRSLTLNDHNWSPVAELHELRLTRSQLIANALSSVGRNKKAKKLMTKVMTQVSEIPRDVRLIKTWKSPEEHHLFEESTSRFIDEYNDKDKERRKPLVQDLVSLKFDFRDHRKHTVDPGETYDHEVESQKGLFEHIGYDSLINQLKGVAAIYTAVEKPKRMQLRGRGPEFKLRGAATGRR